jgi:ribosomal protein L32
VVEVQTQWCALLLLSKQNQETNCLGRSEETKVQGVVLHRGRRKHLIVWLETNTKRASSFGEIRMIERVCLHCGAFQHLVWVGC